MVISALISIAGIGLAILLFIRDWRTTLIATLAIPTSIIWRARKSGSV